MTAVSQEEALALFDRLASKSDFGFNGFESYCHVRAHLMRREMQRQGLEPACAWAVELENNRPLRYASPTGRGVRWSYHVCVALAVVQTDGSVAQMVFDPSMYDGPVCLEAWKDKMAAAPGYAGITPFEATPAQTRLLPDFAQSLLRRMDRLTDEDAERMSLNMMVELYSHPDCLQRVVYDSPLRQEVSANDGSVRRSGDGWVSASLYIEREMGPQTGYAGPRTGKLSRPPLQR